MERLGGPPPPEGEAHFDPFRIGLYAATEMFVDGFLHLYRAGILSREVDGAVLHGGFFLGPKAIYAALREMAPADLARLQMTAVSFTNQLYGGDEAARRRARTGGRFVNGAMMATLTGAVISDGLENGRVVSGVGGQFNFVDQAFALDDAHSILTLNATRTSKGRVESNIRWSYGHETVPRHLKDIVVTEYGAAHLRGRTDRQTVEAMLGIADSRFQAGLRLRAMEAGKLPLVRFRVKSDNIPDRIERALAPARDAGLLSAFPLGTDFDAVELRLLPALGRLRAAEGRTPALLGLLRRGLAARPTADDRQALARMGLDRPRGLKARLYAALLLGAM
jgi:acyl-CoA hydrolase